MGEGALLLAETGRKKKQQPLRCPKCGSKDTIKSGFIQGEQRWKCKSCVYQYTRVIPRGRPIWQKSLVVFLYSYGVTMHSIAKIFDIQPSTVLKWVRAYAKDHAPSSEKNGVHIMALQDMQKLMAENKKENAEMLCIAINDVLFKESTAIIINGNQQVSS